EAQLEGLAFNLAGEGARLRSGVGHCQGLSSFLSGSTHISDQPGGGGGPFGSAPGYRDGIGLLPSVRRTFLRTGRCCGCSLGEGGSCASETLAVASRPRSSGRE